MDRFVDALEGSNHAGMGFLLIELDMALTFLSVAHTSLSDDTALRNRENARLAYESVLRYQGRVQFAEPERLSFEEKLGEVKRALLAVGIDI